MASPPGLRTPPLGSVLTPGPRHPPSSAHRQLSFSSLSLFCARMSCRETAAASVQFNAEGAQVIIVDLADSVEGIPVCRKHVATRSAPVGWTLIDRRTFEQQRMLVAEDGAATRTPMIHSGRSATFAPTVSGPSKRPALRRPPTSGGFPWGDDPTDPGGASMVPAAVEDVSSPLLKRAFRQS